MEYRDEPGGNQDGRNRISGWRRVAPGLLLLALTVAGCRMLGGGAVPVGTGINSAPPASTISPLPPTPLVLPAPAVYTPSPLPVVASPTALVTPSLEELPTLSPTPDPYAGLSIDDLAQRSYGGGQVEILETLAVNSYFTRTLIAYPSDGLTIYGFLNIPQGEGSFPVVIASHGYIEPELYSTLDYTTRYADGLARAGFMVLHPNLRGYPPSDDGDNRFRVGMAVDVLNLIAIVKSQGGQPGPLEAADPGAIGVWGHSMGGGISTRVITVSPDVQAAVLYGAMSGDDRQNYERIYNYFSNGTRGLEELSAPEAVFERVSPIYYLDRIQTAVSIHHGRNDPEVPLAWSQDLCSRLTQLGKEVECFVYPGQGHTFFGEGDELFLQRTITFFDQELRQP